MPELPEVETVRRELEAALLHRTIHEVIVHERRLRTPLAHNFESNFHNLTLNKCDRRAKYLLLGFAESPLTLLIHLGMSGRISIFSQPSLSPALQKHEHIIFKFTSGHEMRFFDPRRFGEMRLISDISTTFQKLGPEPLEEEFTAEVLYFKLKQKNTPVKSALLDQQVVAGLGNIYVCEALHQSGLNPERMAKDISLPELEKLVPKIKEVLLQAIEAGGSTLRDHKRPSGQIGSFQYNFKVYGRDRPKCLSCEEGIIEKLRQANRSTFYCKMCQPLKS